MLWFEQLPDHIEEIHKENGLVFGALDNSGTPIPVEQAWAELISVNGFPFAGDYFTGTVPPFFVDGSWFMIPFTMIVDIDDMTVIVTDQMGGDHMSWSEILKVVKAANK